MLLYLAVLITHFPLSCWISVNFPVVSEAFGVEFDVEYKYLGLSVSLDRQDRSVNGGKCQKWRQNLLLIGTNTNFQVHEF